MRNQLAKIKWLLRYFGPSAPAVLLGRAIPSLGRSQWFSAWKDRVFDRRIDRRHGIETTGVVVTDSLDVPSDLRDHAVEYRPTAAAWFGAVIEGLGISHEQFAFVDYGCGKGRILFMAAEFPFREVIGVELSEQLAQTTRGNIASCRREKLRCQQIHCHQGDAGEFDLPDGDLLLYFFNPFDDVILARVLERVERAFQSSPREIVVVYYHPVHQEAFESSSQWIEQSLPGGNPEGWMIYRHAPGALDPTPAPSEAAAQTLVAAT